MPAPIVFSLVESPQHPNFSALYRRLGLEERRLHSIRETNKLLKKQAPELLVAEFFYGYANNYAGANVSNLDVVLSTLKRYAPHARVVVLADRSERRYVDRLTERFPLEAVLTHPVTEAQMEEVICGFGLGDR